MISPAEIMMELLDTIIPGSLAVSVVVGPITEDQEIAGAVQIFDAGLPRQERYVPVIWVRNQIRCVSASVERTDTIARTMYDLLNGRTRTLVEMPSTSETYLIHLLNVTGGPDAAIGDQVTWDSLLFTEMLIGRQKVS